MKTSLLLIAHGSRHGPANDDLHFFAEQLTRLGTYRHVVASFLELAEPNIVEGARMLVALGAEHIAMVPYFLSAGVHVRRDLQRFRDELALRHPAVTFCLAEPLGRHPLLVEIIQQRADDALNGNAQASGGR